MNCRENHQEMRFVCIYFVAILMVVYVVGALNESVPIQNGTNASALNISEAVVNVSMNSSEEMGVRIENACEVAPLLIVEKEVFNVSERVYFWNKVSNRSFDFLIEYWVEDEQGTVVKQVVQTANANRKQFTPRFESAEIVLTMRNKLVWVACNNTNQELEASQVVRVINPDYVEDAGDVDVPVVVKVPKKTTAVSKAKANTTAKSTIASAPMNKSATKAVQSKTREHTTSAQVPRQSGERVINATSGLVVSEDLVYAGSSERARSYGLYLGIVLVVVVIAGFVIREWRLS